MDKATNLIIRQLSRVMKEIIIIIIIIMSGKQGEWSRIAMNGRGF